MTHNRFTDEWVADAPYIRTHADDMALREQLKAEAEEIMSGGVLDLTFGLISDGDKQKLIAWRLYVKELEALELDTAQSINCVGMNSLNCYRRQNVIRSEFGYER